MLSGDSIRVVHPLFQTEGDGAIPISPLQLEILECHVSLACNLNSHWHSRLPRIEPNNIYRSPPSICFAAIYGNKYYATAIWSAPIARALNGKNYIELRRMAIAPDAPKNTASRMIKVMRKTIQRKFPCVVKLISYQDTEVHNGTIYAASGWVKSVTTKGASWGKSRKRNIDQTTSDKIRWEYEL
jgi:hypothetical protein